MVGAKLIYVSKAVHVKHVNFLNLYAPYMDRTASTGLALPPCNAIDLEFYNCGDTW